MQKSVIVGGSSFLFFFFFMLSMVFFLKGGGEMGSLVLEWEVSERLQMEMSFPMVLDLVSLLFMMTVFFISGCVMLFSGFYMAHETFLVRFLGLVGLFVLSMVLLILFPGYLSLMVGWDGLGVVSFLLVVYYSNSGSLSAGMITAISNRIGDVFFIIVIGLMSSFLSYGQNSSLNLLWPLLGILILMGSITKSAQIPFSAWLPEAMAAPTPVSTLVHSSTLVTAGVYVLIRFNDMLGQGSYYILMFCSMMTVIMAGSGGVLEVDMKKVVALSTLSQVGMMMFSISVGAVKIAFFHLVVHAFFKALMFMCVGGVIFYSGGVQDARFLSGLWVKMPFVCSLLILTNMSLMGFPFMSGFYSKELILSAFLMSNSSLVGFFFLFISLVLTMAYGVRMVGLMLSFGEVAAKKHYMNSNLYYMLALLMMSNGAVTAGMVLQLMAGDLVFLNMMNGFSFYGCLGVGLVWFSNLVFLVNLQSSGNLKKLILWFTSGMWFLKPMSGNVVSSKSLSGFSLLSSLVEMGVVRGYVWSGGLKSSFFSSGHSSRSLSFNLVGVLSFFCFFLWVMVLV